LRFSGIPSIAKKCGFSTKRKLRYLDGSDVGEGEFAKVSTEDFRVHTASIQSRWSGEYSPATATWMIVFNDDVNPAEITGFLGFTSEKSQPVAADLRHPTAAEAGHFGTSYLTWANRKNPEKQRAPVEQDSLVRNIIVVSPNPHLPVAKKWVLRLLKELPNTGKLIALKSDISYQIGEVEPFKVSQVSPQISANPPRCITVYFNRKLSEAFSDEMVSVSPRPENVKITVDNKRLEFTGDFDEHQNYQGAFAETITAVGDLALISAGNFNAEF